MRAGLPYVVERVPLHATPRHPTPHHPAFSLPARALPRVFPSCSLCFLSRGSKLQGSVCSDRLGRRHPGLRSLVAAHRMNECLSRCVRGRTRWACVGPGD